MRSLCRLSVAISIVGACRGGGESRASNGAGATTAAAVTAQPESKTPAVGKAVCPSTGLWSDCAVFDRLDHAGLAPRRDSAASVIHESPLTAPGTRLLVGNAELDLFIYPDAGSRERDESRLDRSKFIEASDEPTLRGEATLIRNANLLAILRSRNDHQRERVSDVLTAGPPQPSSSANLSGARIRK